MPVQMACPGGTRFKTTRSRSVGTGSILMPVFIPGGRQLDRMAVRCMQVGPSPLLLAPVQICAAHQPLFGAESLQGVEPMMVVAMPQVRVTPFLRDPHLLPAGP